MTQIVTCSAPVNIALVKYWGKRDEELILPVNSSLSITLDQAELRTVTTVALVEDGGTRMWLNDEELDLGGKQGGRIRKVLSELAKRAGKEAIGLRIVSRNNFPTAAGLASSAAGLACLAFTTAHALGVEEKYPGELSSIARLGSGSACRSLYGGFVRWNMGEAIDGSDSFAEQVADVSWWSDVRVLICVVDDRKKGTSSTSGMRNSVATSKLLKYRAERLVPEVMRRMEAAILERDFQALAKITMQDSNQFHATCLDTDPPIFYLNDASKAIIGAVSLFNESAQEVRAAYTFDAGPNAVLLTRQQHFDELLALMMCCFPPRCEAPQNDDRRGGSILGSESSFSLDDFSCARSVASRVSTRADEVNYFICSRIGGGPQILGPEEHLLDPDTLLPKLKS